MILLHLIVEYKITNFVYVDECGINKHFQREFGRAKRGVKIQDTKRGKKLKRTNIIGGLWYDGLQHRHVAMKTYCHSTNSEFFEDWFEYELIAVIPEGSVIIMDNASFHRKSILREIAKRHGVILVFLPPYSPDFNPIEKSWANFKRWLRTNSKRFKNLFWAVATYFY